MTDTPRIDEDAAREAFDRFVFAMYPNLDPSTYGDHMAVGQMRLAWQARGEYEAARIAALTADVTEDEWFQIRDAHGDIQPGRCPLLHAINRMIANRKKQIEGEV